jgi:hypothetical protein
LSVNRRATSLAVVQAIRPDIKIFEAHGNSIEFALIVINMNTPERQALEVVFMPFVEMVPNGEVPQTVNETSGVMEYNSINRLLDHIPSAVIAYPYDF